MGSASSWNRVRVERGIYLLPNGKYAICARRTGRLWYRTVGSDLALARSERAVLVAAIEAGLEPVSPRLRFDTIAGCWLARFEAKVAAGERRDGRSSHTATTSSITCCQRSRADECAR